MNNLKPNKRVMGKFFTKYKVLKFEIKSDLISDDDIMDLFMGLVRLIKKNTELVMEEKYLNAINQLTHELNAIKNKI